MAVIKNPLHSEEAQGTLAKSVIYNVQKGIAIAKSYFKPKYTLTEFQITVRVWFKNSLIWWKRMSSEEQFLWDLALKNYSEYSRSVIQYTHRMARCLFLNQTLTTKSFIWEGSPFPPSLRQMLAKDEIEGYDQIISDIETLTGLVFCFEVKPFFFPYLGYVTSKGSPDLGELLAGLANANGVAIALYESFYYSLESWYKKKLVAHELTHCLMGQHDWYYNNKVLISETIANEVGIRIADGNLEPIYKYQGKTLSEWVPKPGCG